MTTATSTLPEPATSNEPRFATARDLVYVLFKYWLRILTVFLTTVLSTYAVISMLTERWDATTTLFVQVGRENAGVPVAVLKEAFVQGGVSPQHVNSEIAALRAPALIAETVDEIGLERFRGVAPRPTTLFGWAKYIVKGAVRGVKAVYEEALYALNLKVRLGERDGAINAVWGGLTLTPVPISQCLDVTLRMADPTLAADVVNSLVQHHLVRRIGYFSEAGTGKLFEEAVGAAESTLQRADADLQRFRASSGISALGPQREAALAQLYALEEKIRTTESSAIGVRAERDALQTRLDSLPTGVTAEQTTRNPVGQQLAERLADLYQKRAGMEGKFRSDSRFVTEIEQEIASVERQMRNQQSGDYGSRTVGMNPTRQEVDRRSLELSAQLVGLEAELQKQTEQREEARTRLSTYDHLEGEARELERRRTLAEENLVTYRKKTEQSQIANEMNNQRITNLVVVSPAVPPLEPAWPRKMLFMGVALAGGLVLGLAAAFLADAVDRSARYSGDLIRIGIPVLATVPEVTGGFCPAVRIYSPRLARELHR